MSSCVHLVIHLFMSSLMKLISHLPISIVHPVSVEILLWVLANVFRNASQTDLQIK